MLTYVLSALSAAQYTIILFFTYQICSPPDPKYSIMIAGFSYCNIIGGDKYRSTTNMVMVEKLKRSLWPSSRSEQMVGTNGKIEY